MSATPRQRAHFLEVADRIGCRLCRDALWAGGRCNWLSWSVARENDQRVAVHRAQGASLGGGVAGIALFLAQLHSVTEDAVTKDTLLGALATLDFLIARLGPDRIPPGYFEGAAGLAATYFEVAGLLRDDRFNDAGLSVLEQAARPGPAGGDAGYDVMAGTAGLIPVLLHAGVSLKQEHLIEAAVGLGRDLLAAGVRSDRGTSWPGQPRAGDHLLGLGFGASGIACALLDLYRVAEDQELLDEGLAALRFERSHFDGRRQGWPHLRAEPITPCGLVVGGPEGGHPVAWCHGAPAVLAGMLRSRELLTSTGEAPEQDVGELEAAIRATSRVGEPDPGAASLFNLCHGRAGCADVLLQAAEVLGRPKLFQAAAAVGQSGVELYHDRREFWPCDVIGFGECPSLLRGLSGIGHFYLRLSRPRGFRSALTPPAHAAAVPVSNNDPRP